MITWIRDGFVLPMNVYNWIHVFFARLKLWRKVNAADGVHWTLTYNNIMGILKNGLFARSRRHEQNEKCSHILDMLRFLILLIPWPRTKILIFQDTLMNNIGQGVKGWHGEKTVSAP